MNKLYQRGLVPALLLAASATCAISAHADTVTIPWSAALQTNPGPQVCFPSFPYVFTSGQDECYLSFPLSIPVGHTIEQIAVIYTTNDALPGQPFFQTWLEADTLIPSGGEKESFFWTTTAETPTATFEKHLLMIQLGKLYPDQFQVAPDTIYHVHVALMNGAAIGGVEVTYN